jgi:hypothetical protein
MVQTVTNRIEFGVTAVPSRCIIGLEHTLKSHCVIGTACTIQLVGGFYRRFKMEVDCDKGSSLDCHAPQEGPMYVVVYMEKGDELYV